MINPWMKGQASKAYKVKKNPNTKPNQQTKKQQAKPLTNLYYAMGKVALVLIIFHYQSSPHLFLSLHFPKQTFHQNPITSILA